MINKNIKSPFKKSFGKDRYDEQRKGASFFQIDKQGNTVEGPLKRTINKKGRV